MIAARLIGEFGYESVTMTAVAERAGASIGTLYDYFPDKQALAQALAAKFAQEADQHWKALLAGSLAPERVDLADCLVEGAMTFLRERPAYLPLFGSPSITFRSPAARQHLRQTFAVALQKFSPELTSKCATLKAQVIVELLKAMFTVCKQVAPKHRDDVKAEFKAIIGFYLDNIAEEDGMTGICRDLNRHVKT